MSKEDSARENTGQRYDGCNYAGWLVIAWLAHQVRDTGRACEEFVADRRLAT